MTIDQHVNFAYTTVATVPSPAASGTSIVVTDGSVFGSTFPIHAVITAAGTTAVNSNSEIVKITARSSNTLTITRAQKGSSARTVLSGDRIYAGVLAHHLTDIEYSIPFNVKTYGAVGDGSTNDTASVQDAIDAAVANGGGIVYFPKGTYKVTNIQIDGSVRIQGSLRSVSTISTAATDNYAATISNGYAEISDIRFLYTGASSQTTGGLLKWENGASMSNVRFETSNTSNKAYRLVDHIGAPSANWLWHNCTFGNAVTAVVDAAVHLDQTTTYPMPGDTMITDCQFLDTTKTATGLRVKGVPSVRLVNPKFLGYNIAVLIDWSNSLGTSNGFYWNAGSAENFLTAGLRVLRSSGSYNLVDNYLSSVEFVPSSSVSGAICVDIQDGSASGFNITGCIMMPVFTNGIGIKLGSGADKVSIVGNLIRGATTGVDINSSATNVYIGGNYFQGCTTDVSDAGNVVSVFKAYGDANVKGYLNVGSTSAPTNTADGDVTALQVYTPKLIGSTTDASGAGLTITTTDHATKGTITFGTSKYDEANNRLGIGMTPTVPLDVTGRVIFQGSHTDAAAFTLNGTVTTASNAVGQVMIVSGTIDGTGNNPAAFRLNTTLAPASGTVGSSYGLRLTPMFAAPTGATQTSVYGSLAQVQTGSAGGTISNLICYYAGKVLGTQIPTTITGMVIDNMGAASVTTATGISINKPTSATNNYYMAFDTADGAAAGAYSGKLPISVAGNLRYLHYFS
jgi:hypothetical protein